MATTAPARSPNRVADLLPAAPPPLPLPTTPAGRIAAYADAVFAAVLALQAQLAHPDAAVVREAAGLILDFEKTRLRHDRPVAGTEEMFAADQSVFAASETSADADAAPFSRGEEPEGTEAELDPEYVEQVRRDLEGMRGTNGIPAVITRGFAEEVARHARDPNLRREARRASVQCPTNDE